MYRRVGGWVGEGLYLGAGNGGIELLVFGHGAQGPFQVGLVRNVGQAGGALWRRWVGGLIEQGWMEEEI